ncbi:MAG: Hsp20/alpha crystallin family protein [Acidobacteria bacterium]|nr:Hsp20/alpha crystallin family protein [Acidobacteriota bacterium]
MPKDPEVFSFFEPHYFTEVASGMWHPNVDLCLKPNCVVVKVEVPGVRKEDLQVSIVQQTLRIRGVKPEPTPEPGFVSYLCVERSYGRFYREIQLSWVVDSARSSAELQNGVLTITLPLREERRGKEFLIPIKKND